MIMITQTATNINESRRNRKTHARKRRKKGYDSEKNIVDLLCLIALAAAAILKMSCSTKMLEHVLRIGLRCGESRFSKGSDQSMKKWTCLLVMLLVLAMLVGCAAASGEKIFVTSFYPMYIFAQNIAVDVPGVQIVNLAGESTGCLHDYQLKTRDMATLEKADALIINGGGMEQFMDKVIAQQPQLAVINASEGIEMLCSEDDHAHDDHAHGNHAHEHEALNAHVWLDPALAIRQVQNIADGLAAADSENAEAYLNNAKAYIARIEALHAEVAEQLAPLAGSEIVTFHEAFDYFAQAYGLRVAAVIASDSGEEPSTRQIARLCDLVSGLTVKALFVEPQYPAKTAETIARETGAKMYTLDPVVTGDGGLDSYENLMRENARVLQEALLP